ncbi:hypothetical protein DFS34DRAFT_583204 [Phlyctochytrium arcticum]|nr:hypothetical protein DFS34DRAFT_583204 [Phlyctochytrium arcticum]
MNNAPLVIPPAPSHIDPSDNTQLAIHYHEIDNLEVSVYYLERASGEGNPLGLYLLGMCLRHGWGVEEDRRRATRCFIRSAQATGLTKKSASPSCESLSNSIDSRQSRVHTQRSASFFPSLARRPSNMSHTSTTSRAFSTWSVFATASRIITGSLSTNPALTFTLGDFQTDMGIMCSILPLPLYELGICFRHGWGVPRSLPAAFYYFSAAGASGDSEAMVEAAYCLLNGTGVAKNRKESGKWFRMAVEAGYEVLGEGWIWKDKWK